MTLQHVTIVFQLIVFVFAISVHESAHAWMANRCGDPTARMLGRITLNPIKHIDLFGTVLLPLVAMLSGIPVLGWAKPTPVDQRNFKHPMRDDILTSVVGPVSNFLLAAVATLLLVVIKVTSPLGREVVSGMIGLDSNSILVPVCLFIQQMLMINVVLGVFNLIPVPPLDGSHVLRHFLPPEAVKVYDSIGFFALLALIYLGGGYLDRLFYPVLRLFTSVVASV